jgi:hypothetical protein
VQSNRGWNLTLVGVANSGEIKQGRIVEQGAEI